MVQAREASIDTVADHIVTLAADSWVRVAVDGVTAAGKSTFAARLTDAVAARGRPAEHLSTDDFHHVAQRRHRDPDRARGYYRDAYDLDAFGRMVLEPLSPAGSGRYRRRAHDLQTDELLDEPEQVAVAGLVVVVDGTFLQSAVLAGGWDVIVWLDTPFDVAVERAVPRDRELFGGDDAVRVAYRDRYHAACRLYIDEMDPRASAGFVVAP